jgi:competence protein ComEA
LFLLCLSFSAAFATSKININKATVAELVALPGVGEKTAVNVVEYRQAHGDFKSIDEIIQVKGVGEKTFAKVAEQISVTDE